MSENKPGNTGTIVCALGSIFLGAASVTSLVSINNSSSSPWFWVDILLILIGAVVVGIGIGMTILQGKKQ